MINTIKTFEELREKILVEGDFLSTFIRGHLMIDCICKKILEMQPISYSRNIEKLEYFKLINALCDLNYIYENEKNILLGINRLRNKLAHDLTFFPTITEMKQLLWNARDTFIEFFEGFSRGLIALHKAKLLDNSEIEILIDFFMEILSNLKCRYDSIFEESYPDQIA